MTPFAPSRDRALLALEFCALFVGLPLFAAWLGPEARRWVIPQILLLAAVLFALLMRDPTFDRRQLSRIPRRWRAVAARIVLGLAAGGAAVLTLAWLDARVHLFALPRRDPGFWCAILLLYPVLSALPQELIFRVFVFHRYRALFTRRATMIAASAASFALAHVQLGNAVAPSLALAGGALFAYRYAATRSLPTIGLEHGLWGDWLFTIGMGTYFYGGHF